MASFSDRFFQRPGANPGSIAGSIGESNTFDPELLYVECHRCGRPVMWESGRTTTIMRFSGLEAELIDERCLILSEGCPSCSPDDEYYETHIVRLSDDAFIEEIGGYSGESGSSPAGTA